MNKDQLHRTLPNNFRRKPLPNSTEGSVTRVGGQLKKEWNFLQKDPRKS